MTRLFNSLSKNTTQHVAWSLVRHRQAASCLIHHDVHSVCLSPIATVGGIESDDSHHRNLMGGSSIIIMSGGKITLIHEP